MWCALTLDKDTVTRQQPVGLDSDDISRHQLCRGDHLPFAASHHFCCCLKLGHLRPHRHALPRQPIPNRLSTCNVFPGTELTALGVIQHNTTLHCLPALPAAKKMPFTSAVPGTIICLAATIASEPAWALMQGNTALNFPLHHTDTPAQYYSDGHVNRIKLIQKINPWESHQMA